MVAELLGSFVLVFGVLATIKASSAKTFNLTGTAKNVFVALGVALSLMAAVYVAETSFFGTNARGYVNPAVALMDAIGHNEWKFFAPALVGEIIGGLVALLVVLVADKIMRCEKPSQNVATFAAKESFFGEVAGSIIFIGGVAIAVFANINGNFSGLIVGLSIFASLILVGWRFALLLNPMVGLVLIVKTAVQKQFQIADLKNYGVSLVGNLSVAAAIGAVYYGLSQM